MSDRKAYFAKYYKKHKKKNHKKACQWLKNKKKELGPEGFKAWKSIQNAKYRAKVKLKND